MKNYLFNILLLCSINLFAQTNLSNNKEYFDFLYRYNLNQQNLNSSDPRYFGNTISWDMMQLINLYTATKDKSYLVQFIHLSAIAINNRFDVKNNFATQWPPKWTLTSDNSNKESTYFNTLLSISMAKFVYQIRNTQGLYNNQLPFNTQSTDLSHSFIYNDLTTLTNSYPSISLIDTYGDYADWLGARVEETMKYLDDHYWNDSFGHVKFLGEQNAAELNFQSSFATLYLWMYKINHSFSTNALSHSHIHDRLEILKNKYNALFFRHCISNGIGGSTIESVFNEINSNGNQLFVWSHWGWRDYGCDTRWKEDLAHGATDLWFPITDNQLGQEF